MPSNPFTDPHWATSVVDAIDSFVAFIRDRTTKPAVVVLRALIFGTMAIVGVLFVSVIFFIPTRSVPVAGRERCNNKPTYSLLPKN